MFVPPPPRSMSLVVHSDVSLAELRDYIDWTPFFLSWELRGRYPDILHDEIVGAEAKRLFDDAQELLDTIVNTHGLQARACAQIFAANSSGDDIVLWTDDSRTVQREKLLFLRQQGKKAGGTPNLCLSDYVAPIGGPNDYVGAFVVTAGIGSDELCKHYESMHDDYSSILVKALADRLAEACAEWLHQLVRRDVWGYVSGENLPNSDLIAESYQGIRPAPGYPACPDHTEKEKLFALLNAPEVCGVNLTESFAMYPAASVSGWYFAHPDSKYFAVGKIGKDQVEDYAQRKGWSVELAERWLAPILGYDA